MINNINLKNPKISKTQLKNVKIYSDREEFVNSLNSQLCILEIGTLAGDYADLLLTRNPKTLDLLDSYNSSDMHGLERFEESNHYEYVQNKYKNNVNVNIIKGLSDFTLPSLNKKYYDYIYIDADHSYESISNDLNNSIRLLKDDGIIGLNDYLIADINNNKYDTVFAVNKFLHDNHNWEVIGIALHPFMFCDIYIKKMDSF